MKFEVYGHFTLEVQRENDQWRVHRLSPGKRVPEPGIVLPSNLDDSEIGQAIDDLFHELARPGDSVVRVDQREQVSCGVSHCRRQSLMGGRRDSGPDRGPIECSHQ